ncbi:putative sulfatase YidJ [Flagellimonas maritima]|uniref:Putative sulfatase YidJ n=1 Tax=Flagellimonas maritima TaxID=1383885 RepID=A0A2Z4LQ54_9FLAO|nr:sulfatase [Allomuricauda aurantiaca]AWX43704.1 putative sulfatase YidJ [Allomuricauda aurantiaca]
MKSTYFNFSFFCIAVLICVLGCNRSKRDIRSQNENNTPNIIFLLTDDQRWDALGYAGNSDIITPNLDTLAAESVYFKNAYVTTSICAVSRASILTGQYARRHNIWGFAKNFSEEQLQNTYPLLLRKAGYHIGFIGKYGVGNKLPSKHFDYWKGFPGQGTFNERDENGDSIHLTKKIGKQIVDFLELQQGNEKPFSLSVSFKAPHVESDPGHFNPDRAYDDLYVTDSMNIPKTSIEAFRNYFPERFTENNVARNRWETRFANPTMQQESIKDYYRLIYGVDQVVGKLRKELERLNLDQNTIIIFTSDNGFYLGEYGLAGKWYGSEPSIRVPMIIYNPSDTINAQKTINDKVLNIDIAPTILSYAGIQLPEQMQGKDLSELIDGKNNNWRNEFFYEHIWESSEAYYIPSTEGVVSGDKKYMKYFMNRDTTDVIFEELYDLSKDPKEINNLIGKPEANGLEMALRKKYVALKKAGE